MVEGEDECGVNGADFTDSPIQGDSREKINRDNIQNIYQKYGIQ